MQSITTIAGKVGMNLIKAHLHSGRCRPSALILLSHLQVSALKRMRSCKIMTAASNIFQGIKYLLHQRPVRLLISRLRQRLHQKSVSVVIGLMILFTVMMHVTSCTHAPKSNPSVLIEAKPKLIAQQTTVNNANNYVYAPKGLYQHTDQTISGVMPESLATDTNVAVHQSIEGETK